MLWAGRREVLHSTALSSGGPQSVALLFLLPALMGTGPVQRGELRVKTVLPAVGEQEGSKTDPTKTNFSHWEEA